ncbi:MAG: 30S ribosomal protein S12 methylthiotransferase RimO [Elusimicrobia bacterium]|nr:30S ribosomal protein S12 methylthiotransferase RimO [Candidatus Liberimonas magnetica]
MQDEKSPGDKQGASYRPAAQKAQSKAGINVNDDGMSRSQSPARAGSLKAGEGFHRDKNKVCLVALGCPKNMVEVESLAGLVKDNGWDLTTDLDNSKAAIVHTCSFIKDARDESAGAIKALSEIKKKGKLEKLIVSGCMVQGEGKRLIKEFPDVDGFIGTGNLKGILKLLSGEKKFILGTPGGLLDSYAPRLLSSNLPTAYLRLAEGCNHRCSFCSIPYLRGKYKSRNISSIIKEAEDLSFNGIKELILVAQDTTYYGHDIYGKNSLPELLRKLTAIKGISWIRIMYTYPDSIDERLLDIVKSQDKVCKYLDMPLQHISENVLKRMRRHQNVRETVKSIKNRIPDLALRTALIVGFPGESEKDFKEMHDFVAQGWFDQLGVFEYSDDKNIVSHKLTGQVSQEIRHGRRKQLMLKQKEIVLNKNRAMKGKVFKVLVETADKNNICSGRAYFQAPEIDNKIFFKGSAAIGSFRDVKITGYKGYDLYGEIASA